MVKKKKEREKKTFFFFFCGLLGIYNVYFRSTQRQAKSRCFVCMYLCMYCTYVCIQLYWDLGHMYVLGFLDCLKSK